MVVRYTDEYERHVALSYTVAEDLIRGSTLTMMIKKRTTEHQEKIMQSIFQDLIRRFKGDAWRGK